MSSNNSSSNNITTHDDFIYRAIHYRKIKNEKISPDAFNNKSGCSVFLKNNRTDRDVMLEIKGKLKYPDQYPYVAKLKISYCNSVSLTVFQDKSSNHCNITDGTPNKYILPRHKLVLLLRKDIILLNMP